MIQSFVKTAISIIIIVIFNVFADAQTEDFINFRERWAILIGVGRYLPNSGIKSLESPESDVKLMEKILVQDGGFTEVKTLVDYDATYSNINEALSDFIDKVTEEDLVVFYFSGRGARINDDYLPDEPDKLDECLLSYDAVKKSKQNFLRDDEIGEYLNTLGARRAVIIIDSSYSGENNGKGIITEDVQSKSEEVDGITQTDFLPGETTVVLEASNPDGTVVDGVFTRLFSPEYAAEQDANINGFITVYEFFTYARNQLNKNTAPPQIGHGESEARRIPLVRPLLEVTSNPSSTTIKINGQNIGTTPSIIALNSGSHSLEVQKRGYKIWSSRVESTPGLQRINCRLTSVEVSGTAVYGKTRRPLANATLELRGTRHPVNTTNESGRFSFGEWEQYGVPRAGLYQIEILDTPGRIKKGQITSVKIPENLYDDIPLGEIQLTEIAKISLEVYTQPDRKITDAVVIVNKKQFVDVNQDGTYEIEIENPDFSMPFTVSREDYETYEGTIRVLENVGQPYPVQLQPAIHTFSVEVKIVDNPVSGIAVILNDMQLTGITDSQGKIEDKKQLVPDESLQIKIKKDASVRELSKSEWTIEKIGKNEYKILVTPQTLPIRVIDQSEEPVSEVNISGGLTPVQTGDDGRANILLFGEPAGSSSLSFNHPYLSKPKSETIPNQTSEQVVHLEIPGEVSISLVAQDENQNPIPGLDFKINNESQGKTDSDGKIKIKYRIDLEDLKIFKSQLEFEKHNIPYRPVNLEHRKGEIYATLHIEYGNVMMQIYTEIDGKRIDLNFDPKIYIDSEAKAIQILPGNHELEVVVENDTVVKQSIDISPGENKLNVEIDQYSAWKLCLNLSQKTPKKEIIETAKKVAEALGRSDMATIFQKRMER